MSTILHQQRKEEKMKILRKIKRIISEPSPADRYGGIGNPKLANKIRGVSKHNLMGRTFHYYSNYFFGNIAPYTGY